MACAIEEPTDASAGRAPHGSPSTRVLIDRDLVVADDLRREQVLLLVDHVAEQPVDELRQLDVGKWKAPVWAGQKMPFLSELLDSIPDKPKKRVFIEIKIGPEAAAPVVAAIKSRGLAPEHTAVIIA